MPDGEISNVEAVRQAIAAGVEKPADGVLWIKTRYGIEMNAQAFSTNKSNILKKQEETSATTRVTKTVTATPPTKTIQAPAMRAATANGVTNGTSAAFDLELARQIKQLVAAHGAEKVKGLVDLFE